MDLKIEFRADRETRAKIREAVPSASVRGGVLHVRIRGADAGEVAEKARELLERLRSVAAPGTKV